MTTFLREDAWKRMGGVVAAAALLWAGCGTNNPDDPRYVMAKGDGFTVKKGEVNAVAAVERERAQVREAGKESLSATLQAIQKDAFAQVLENKLLRLEAKSVGVLEEAEKAAEAEVKTFEKRYSSEEARERFYKTTGTTPKLFKERTLDRMILARIQKKAGLQRPRNVSLSRPTPPPRPASDRDSGRLMIQQLFVPAGTGDSLAKAQALAQEWKASAGKTWPQAGAEAPASTYQRRQYMPQAAPEPLKAAATKLKAGEFSGVLSKPEGHYVLHAISLEDMMRQRREEQEKARLEREQAQRTKWEAYIASLKEKYHVQVTAP
jgi:hypothetical protein